MLLRHKQTNRKREKKHNVKAAKLWAALPETAIINSSVGAQPKLS